MSAEDKKVIYSMIGVSKFYGKEPVLKNIHLSYFYGAKIGVLGLNGSGKSTLLQILAGVDTPSATWNRNPLWTSLRQFVKPSKKDSRKLWIYSGITRKSMKLFQNP